MICSSLSYLPYFRLLLLPLSRLSLALACLDLSASPHATFLLPPPCNASLLLAQTPQTALPDVLELAETILARHAGMRVAALSLMTNYAAGLVPGALAHEQTLAVAGEASAGVCRVLRRFLEAFD